MLSPGQIPFVKGNKDQVVQTGNRKRVTFTSGTSERRDELLSYELADSSGAFCSCGVCALDIKII